MGLAESIILKYNAEKEKYLTVYDVVDIIDSDDTELVIHIMDSLDLFSLTIYELNKPDSYKPIYKPICSSYELKQKIRDYRKASRQLDNYSEAEVFNEYITLQRCLKRSLWSRFDLLKIENEDIAKNTSLIVWGDSNALYSMYSDIINKSDSEYYELPKSSQQAIKDYIAEIEHDAVDAKATDGFLMEMQTEPQTDTEVIKKLKKQITDLESDLEQAHAVNEQLMKQSDKPASAKELNPKDSAYCLIAVLKDLLLNPDIGAYHFKSDSKNSSNKPSQTGLANYIDEMKIFGIKKDNINILFTDANKKLKNIKKKS